jgi:DNA-binding MarR family transcriptional regulator
MNESAHETAITGVTAVSEGEAELRHAVADERLDAADGLIQLSRLVQDIHARISERHNLTTVQAKLICILVFGPRGMAELAQLLGVEKAALTGLVDRAERRGLVRRSPVPGDRRALRVTLTDTGRRAARAFHADATAQLNDLLTPLAPADREHFRSAMAKVIAVSQVRAAAGKPL